MTDIDTNDDMLSVDPDELLKSAQQPLLKAKEALEEEAGAHTRALSEINEKLKRINRTLQTLEPRAKSRPRQKSSGGAVSGTVQVSETTVKNVLAKLEEKGEGTITELSEELGISGPSVSAAFRELRVREQIRLAGRKGMSQLFKPMNGEYHKPMIDTGTVEAAEPAAEAASTDS